MTPRATQRQLSSPVRRSVEPHEVLGGEDKDAGCIEAEQFDLEQLTARRTSPRRWDNSARNRLDDVDDDAACDEEARDVVEGECRGARSRVLKGTPHFLPERRLRVFDRFLDLQMHAA